MDGPTGSNGTGFNPSLAAQIPCAASASSADDGLLHRLLVQRQAEAGGVGEVHHSVHREHGFAEIEAPMGSTGHSGCDRLFVREL